MKTGRFVYPKDLRFYCLKCGICCGDTKLKHRHVLLTQEEAEEISTFLGKPILDFAGKTCGRAPYLWEMKKSQELGQCLFLKDSCCTIYAERPMICRFYPFELKSSASEGFKFFCTSECPGIGKGRVLREGHFQRLFQLARRKLEASRSQT